jgi:uroporphyrinogen decarboxylase
MAETMDSIERVGLTIDLKIPDRVPTDLHNFQPAAKAMGISMADVFRDGDLLAQAMLEAWKKFGHDMILLENGTGCNAEACGVGVIYRDDAAPVAHIPVLKHLEDIDEMEVPDPYTTFPMTEILKATRILDREIGDKVWICARADQGPMDLASQIYGIDNLMLDIALGERPELIHKLLDFSRRVATRYAYALMESGGRSTSIGEPVGGPDLLSPKHYREYPYIHEKRMVEELKQHGIILHNHICGNTIPIIDDFVGTGAQVLEIDHKTDMQKAKDAARHKTTLLGPINTSLLLNGTPEAVDAAAREAIEIMAPDGGFILGPGCALDPNVPDDNIHALIEAAEKYGRYNGR